MENQYQITVDEYVQAGLLNGELSRKTKQIHWAIEAGLLALGAVFFYLNSVALAFGMIGAVLGANLLPYLLRKLFVPWSLRRHYKNYLAIQKPTTISVLDQGVKFASPSGEGTILWGELHHWRENAELILLYPAPRIYYMVPKRVAESISLVENLKRHVGDAR